MDQEVQHVVPLPTYLQASFDPVKLGALEELGALEGLEQVSLLHVLGRTVLERVQDVALKELLVADTDLDGLSSRGVFSVPGEGKVCWQSFKFQHTKDRKFLQMLDYSLMLLLQVSFTYQFLTRGMSIARRVRPLL